MRTSATASAICLVVVIAPVLMAATPKEVTIDRFSVAPLYVEQCVKTESGLQEIGRATGFVVNHRSSHFLITNWHVVTGRHPSTGEPSRADGQTPTHLAIYHHGDRLGSWRRVIEELYTPEGAPAWLEHPNGRGVDVAAVRIEPREGVTFHPLPLDLADADIRVEPAMQVSIIGFPLGLVSQGDLPVWKTGHIATEPDLDFDDKKIFLVDATTRSGMSGAPVIVRLRSGYQTRSGSFPISARPITRFLGVYSGRLPRDSELGKVWRPENITEIISRALE